MQRLTFNSLQSLQQQYSPCSIIASGLGQETVPSIFFGIGILAYMCSPPHRSLRGAALFVKCGTERNDWWVSLSVFREMTKSSPGSSDSIFKISRQEISPESVPA